jgi:hypothetical protein
MLGTQYHGTKLEANTCNSVPNHSAEEKTTWNSVSWNKNRSKLSKFRSAAVSEENILFAGAGFFVKLFFFMPFPSVLSLGMPWNEHFLQRNNGNHSESIPQNFFGTKFHCQP